MTDRVARRPSVVGKVTKDFRDGRVEVTFTEWEEVRVVTLLPASAMPLVPDLTNAKVKMARDGYTVLVPAEKHCATCQCGSVETLDFY